MKSSLGNFLLYGAALTAMASMTAAYSFGLRFGEPVVGLFGTSANVSLERIDVQHGKQDVFGPRAKYEAQAQELSALDEFRNIYYIIGFNASIRAVNLVGFHTTTGKVVHDIKLPFYEGTFVGLGQSLGFDPSKGKPIVGGRLEKKGPHVIGYVDLSSGSFEKVAAINKTDLPVLSGVGSFDPSSGKFVTMFGIRGHGIDIFAVDMASGSVEKIKEDPEEGREIVTLDYDPKSKTMVGLGVQPNATGGITRTLVSLDVKNQKWHTIGKIDNFLIADGSISALNVQQRELYWIGQKEGASKNDPFYLIGVNVENANVPYETKFCNQSACPWSLEYHNKVSIV